MNFIKHETCEGDTPSPTPEKETTVTKRLYQVYDIVAGTVIGGIVQETNDAPAIRSFTDALRNKDSILAQHPEDYQLLLLGEQFSSGLINPLPNPEVILTGKTWKEMNNA